jgi:hypothetical protein
MGDERKYDPEQVRDILGRAAARSTEAGDAIGHRTLLEAAREAGIDPAAVEDAIRASDRARARGEIVSELREKHRSAAIAHGVAFAFAVGTFLIFAAAPARATLAILLGALWLLALLAHGIVAFAAPDSAEVDELLHAREAQARALEQARLAEAAARAEREAQQARDDAKKASREKLSAAAARFETAVEQGVSAALAAAAEKLESLTAKAQGPGRAEGNASPEPTDFARYVASRAKRAEPPSPSREPSAPTGVRVAGDTAGSDPSPREVGPHREARGGDVNRVEAESSRGRRVT